jgi:phage baseplate assembly protein W
MFEIDPLVKNIRVGLTGIEEIVQNCQIILSTPKGSVPLDRDFGTSWTLIDQPTPKAMAQLRVEILGALEKYEPRVKVKEISFDGDTNGRLIPRVKIDVQEGT